MKKRSPPRKEQPEHPMIGELKSLAISYCYFDNGDAQAEAEVELVAAINQAAKSIASDLPDTAGAIFTEVMAEFAVDEADLRASVPAIRDLWNSHKADFHPQDYVDSELFRMLRPSIAKANLMRSILSKVATDGGMVWPDENSAQRPGKKLPSAMFAEPRIVN